MKKSELYHLAEVAVITTNTISVESKIEVLRVLFESEDVALFCEKKEEENATL